MIARDDKHVSDVYRLHVHERYCVSVLVADRNFTCALDQIAENAMSGVPGHWRLAVGTRFILAPPVPRQKSPRNQFRGLNLVRVAPPLHTIRYIFTSSTRRLF